jgi:predicted transcriptional regulator
MTRDKKHEDLIDAAFKFSEHVVEEFDRYPDEFIAIPMTSKLAGVLFTEARRQLLEELRSHGEHESIASLAACVNRDPSRVGRDLKPLIDAGLVRAKPFGKTKYLSVTNRPVILS